MQKYGLTNGDGNYKLCICTNDQIISEDEDDLKYTVRKQQEENEAAGLTTNMGKYEYVVVNNTKVNNLKLLEGRIKRMGILNF